MWRRILKASLPLAALAGVAFSADAGTLYVASNGLDVLPCAGGSCGSAAGPCRSITCAIGNATPGDTILVGPGRYGDLNRNGVLGEAGEETPSPGCGCMLSINKPVTLASTAGAAATVIDARSVAVYTNVLVITTDASFGKRGKGFTVASDRAFVGNGIAIDGARVRIEGNQVLNFGQVGAGIHSLAAAVDVLIQGNQVSGWTWGILPGGGGATVRANVTSLNFTGVDSYGSSLVVGNVVVGNEYGLGTTDDASAVGNAIHGNSVGILSTGGRTIEGNNVFGNFVPGDPGSCGLVNDGVLGLPAANNYWGAATGPGPSPADRVLDRLGGATSVVPFATRSFRVRAPIKP